MKLKMSKLKIIALLFVLINLFSVMQVSAQSQGLDYAGVNIINPMDPMNKRVLTNGIATLKDLETTVGVGHSSQIFIGSSNSTITDGFQTEIIYDYRAYKEAMGGYAQMEFQIFTMINFYFAGLNRFVVARYVIYGDGSIFFFLNLWGSQFTNTIQPLNSDLVVISIQYFMQWVQQENRNYGNVRTSFFHKNYTDTNAQLHGGLSYSTQGLWSVGNCFINSEEYNFYYNNIGLWGSGTPKTVKNSWIKAYRAIYLTYSDLESFPAIPRIDYEKLDGPSIDYTKPPTSTYWEYNSFNLETVSNRTTNFQQNYSVYNETANATEEKSFEYTYNFGVLAVISKTNQYYYSTQTIAPESWGSWTVSILNWGWLGAYRIDFNWLRNFFVWTVNSIIFLFQAILFLLIIAFNYLIVWLFLQIIVLVWNYPIYWISLAAVAIVFYIIYFIVWLWNQAYILWKIIIWPIISWFWENVIVPAWNAAVAALLAFIDWLKADGIKLIVAFILTIYAYIISAILWALTLGSVDYNAIFTFILTINMFLFGFLFDSLSAVISNFLILIQAVVLYFVVLSFLMLKLLYAKAKGYTSRVEKLQSAINFYKYPIDMGYRFIQMFLGMKGTENR